MTALVLAGAALVAVAGLLYAGAFRCPTVNFARENIAAPLVGAIGVVLLVAGVVLAVMGAL